MRYEYQGRTIEQLSELIIEHDFYTYEGHFYLVDGKRFETQHDLECYLDSTYLPTLQARKKSHKPKKKALSKDFSHFET